MTSLFARHAKGPLLGRAKIPGDKSISHRALIFGALAVGETNVTGMLRSQDVFATAAALRAFGADITITEDGAAQIHGVGVGGFFDPEDVIDLGNSGTSARLLLGLAASQPISGVFTGDASLRSRPMERVMTPLRQMGARFQAREGGRMPVSYQGPETALPIVYQMPVYSAQVKSAVLLAGLNAPGETTVIETVATRDHTEYFLEHFGAVVRIESDETGKRISVTGEPELRPAAVNVPADPSSAAFVIVAALLRPGSEIVLENINLNPLRTGLIETLVEMGGNIVLENQREEQGETCADLRVGASALRGIELPRERVPAMIDELPVLAVAASFAEGRTVISGAEEMRVKESDRIDAMVTGLKTCGVSVEEMPDGMVIQGGFIPVEEQVDIKTHLDHRIAMSFITCATVGGPPVIIGDEDEIATSFPNFVDLMTGLGADIERFEAKQAS